MGDVFLKNLSCLVDDEYPGPRLWPGISSLSHHSSWKGHRRHWASLPAFFLSTHNFMELVSQSCGKFRKVKEAGKKTPNLIQSSVVHFSMESHLTQ